MFSNGKSKHEKESFFDKNPHLEGRVLLEFVEVDDGKEEHKIPMYKCRRVSDELRIGSKGEI